MSLEELRDVIIIAAGALTILVLLAIFVITIVVGLAARTLLRTVQTLLKGEVTPLLDSARQTLDNVRGTTAFIGQTAVSPIIRVYGLYAGAKRMVGVLGGLAGRRNRRR